MRARVFAASSIVCTVTSAMSLAPHQKATTELAGLRSKLSTLAGKAATWQAHHELTTVLLELERAQKALTAAQQGLARLPADYTPHASKFTTTDIEVGKVVYLRDTKRAKYKGLIQTDGAFKVLLIGSPFVTLETSDGVRFAASRGDITTVQQP